MTHTSIICKIQTFLSTQTKTHSSTLGTFSQAPVTFFKYFLHRLSLCILWLYGSATCYKKQPHLKWFTHNGRRGNWVAWNAGHSLREKKQDQRVCQVSCRGQRGWGDSWRMLFVWSSFNQEERSNNSNSGIIKTTQSFWWSVVTTQPGHRRLTAVKPYPGHIDTKETCDPCCSDY